MSTIRKWRALGVSLAGAGLGLFLTLKLGAFSELQNWFDGGSSFAWIRDVIGACAASLLVWRAEAKAKRFAFGEAAIMVWMTGFAAAYGLASLGVFGLPAVSFSLTILASTFGLYAARAAWEEDGRHRLAHAFKTYVAPELVQEIEKNPEALKINGERRDLSVLFTDIQNFTKLSEKLTPEELMVILNRYFSGVTEIVFRYGGTLDKYMGDGVMAFWNAPTAAVNYQRLSTLAARDINEFSQNFFREIEERTQVKLGTRIGVNTGEAIVGNFGSSFRFSYTAIGDEANLAARLESLNTQYGTTLLFSESTVTHVEDVKFRFLDEVRVKGKNKPVRIYTLSGGDKLNSAYEQAFLSYRKGDFAGALKGFTALQEEHPEDGPTRVMIARCLRLQAEPPQNWDGIFSFQEK